MRMFSIIAGAALLSACAPVERVAAVNQFDPAEVAWSKGEGTNAVTGQAFARQAGGGVVTCAGEDVFLTPRSTYNAERSVVTFGSADKPAYRSFSSVIGGKISEEPSAASKAFTRTTVCDAEGDFSFENLPDGDYFLGTQVQWTAGRSAIPEGGGFFAPVSLKGGEAKRVIMKP